MLKLSDQVAVIARRLHLLGRQMRQQRLDAVDRRQHQRHRRCRHRQRPIAEFPQQSLARMRQRLEARQSDEPARPLDGVNQPEDVVQRRLVAWIALEAHQLHIDHVEALGGLGQEFTQQIVHGAGPAAGYYVPQANNDMRVKELLKISSPYGCLGVQPVCSAPTALSPAACGTMRGSSEKPASCARTLVK